MVLKTFPLTDAGVTEFNDFIKTVSLIENSPIQIINDNTIAVFYECEKEEYTTFFTKKMVELLNKNLHHEKVRLLSVECELETAKTIAEGKSTKSEEARTLRKKEETLQEVKSNIDMFEKKIDVYTKLIAN